ncbi:protein-tyrosine-phosphatase ASCRUDRAFT_29007 [Ascoidea rubescens DSM 1968]|uniref:Protein-tyrosine phosphatase n=1 Tax=Ascoidea rubescens DSM 1968 TaxID=1344418 RepID=A0A1D2VP44_9ASCO|nr:hypothetical protein ASCRUDRAFT_29007 [Ascoidea rubescens DSM 1968]ODV63392.1 hypothetical protein ASCRUDRAFT_29007 [Ascoidea rubescens DSM 1968]
MPEDRVLDLITPPLRFTALQPNLYRGSYPRPINYRFLKRLRLKYILSLIPSPITEKTDRPLQDFCREQNIKLLHIECSKDGGKGKKRNVPITYSIVIQAIEIIINSDYSPLYIHCLTGSHITSLIVACLRKISFWSSVSIFNEFINYSATINFADRSFVEKFEGDIFVPEDKINWIFWNGFPRETVLDTFSIKLIKSQKENGNEKERENDDIKNII